MTKIDSLTVYRHGILVIGTNRPVRDWEAAVLPDNYQDRSMTILNGIVYQTWRFGLDNYGRVILFWAWNSETDRGPSTRLDNDFADVRYARIDDAVEDIRAWLTRD